MTGAGAPIHTMRKIDNSPPLHLPTAITGTIARLCAASEQGHGRGHDALVVAEITSGMILPLVSRSLGK